MKTSKAIMLVAAGLVAGLVLGSIGIASAATTSTATGTAAACGGFGGGSVIRAAGATLADVVAKLTGQSVDDVRAQRQDGKSFADIAKAKGVSADKVTSSALDTRKAALAAAVKDGKLSQEQADFMVKNMETRIQDRVNSTAAGCTGSGAGNGGGCGGGGCGGGGMGRGAGNGGGPRFQ
jgi:hypothetical protein